MPLKLLPLHRCHLDRFAYITSHAFYESGCPNNLAMFGQMGADSKELHDYFYSYQVKAFDAARGIVFMGVFDVPADDDTVYERPVPKGHESTQERLVNGHPVQKPLPAECLIAVARMRLEDSLTASEPATPRIPPIGANEVAYHAFFDMLGECKKSTMGSRTYWNLDLLATVTEAQGRGAGRMLVNCMVQWADETRGNDGTGPLGVDCFLEATEMGRPLYEKCGFECLRECSMKATRFGQSRDGSMAIMVRPGKGVMRPASPKKSMGGYVIEVKEIFTADWCKQALANGVNGVNGVHVNRDGY